jgi:CRP-like cAMP-binding protein
MFLMITRNPAVAEKPAPWQYRAMVAKPAGAGGPVDPLGGVAAFRALSAADRDALKRELKVRQLRAREALFREGEPGASLFIITHGELRALVEGTSGKTLRDMAVGELVGEMNCIDPAPRSVTVIATSVATVSELDRAALEKLRAQAPRVAQLIVDIAIKTVTARLRELDRRVAVELGEPEPQVAPVSPGGRPSAAPRTRPSVTAPAAAKPAGLSRLVGWLRGSQ